jgi:hypothetical protein
MEPFHGPGHGGGHEGHGHGADKHSYRFDKSKRHSDGGYALSLNVLGSSTQNGAHS